MSTKIKFLNQQKKKLIKILDPDLQNLGMQLDQKINFITLMN